MIRPRQATVFLLAFLAPACNSRPLERPIVDPESLSPKAGAPVPPAAFEPADPFLRLYQGPSGAGARPAWLAGLKESRTRDLKQLRKELGNDPLTVHDRPEFAWTRRNYIQAKLFAYDRFLYDPGRREYSVDRYLDDLERRFGGVDSVILSAAYPRLGIDERNQFDLLRDLPGGLPALRQVVTRFHQRGVKVFLSYHPWDGGTRPEPLNPERAFAAMAKAIGADGMFGDTMVSVDRRFFEEGERIGHPLALEPEAGLGEAIEAVHWISHSWAWWRSYPETPGVDRYKWLEPRFLNHVVGRDAQTHVDGLQYAWFNGAGFLAWENLAGIWNGIVPRDAERIRRMRRIYRALPEFPVSAAWEPHAETLQKGVYASQWPLPYSGRVWTLVNRSGEDRSGPQLRVDYRGQRFYELWTGAELRPDTASRGHFNPLFRGPSSLSFLIEAQGFAAVLETNEEPHPGSPVEELLRFARERARLVPRLSQLPGQWHSLPQRIVDNPPARRWKETPPGMVRIPAVRGWRFFVQGTTIEDYEGAGVQYPWETRPAMEHDHPLDIPAFFLDRLPVTNADYQRYLESSGFRPADSHNFLRDWPPGKLPPSLARKALTWVSIEEARLYCRFLGKRLPREWEWQYAAQGSDGRRHPWGDRWDPRRVPSAQRERSRGPAPDVGSFPEGASPFGVLDLQGLIWHWTDEFVDTHSRSAVLKGGSFYQPAGSSWYFPTLLDEGDAPGTRGRHQVNQHGKYPLIAPGSDRAGTIGFRCAADAVP